MIDEHSHRLHPIRVAQLVRRDPGLACVVLAIIAVIALYAVTLSRGLVNLDDPWLIRDNWIVQDASWSSIRTIFFDLESPRRFTLAPEYLPIRDVSVMLDFAIWGDRYGGFHLTNLLLYLAAIVLWFQVLVGFGIDRRIVGIALLLWALHPVHAESVCWLSERKGLLGIMFAGACGAGYLRFRAGRSPAWLVLALAMGVCAVWSKAISAFAVAALLPLDLLLPLHGAGRRRMIGLGAIGVAGALAFVPVLLLATSSHVVGTTQLAPAGRLEMVLGVLGFYVRLGSMTTRNSVSYPISNHGPTAIEIALGIVALAVLASAFLVRTQSRASPVHTLRVAAVLWIMGWLPVSHVVLPLQMVFVADRYLLFPSLGLALALAVAVTRISSTRARRALLATIVVASALRTIDAQATWRNNSELWRRAVETNPSDGDAWSMYADAVMEDGRMDLAFEIVTHGLQQSRSPRVLLRKALFLIKANKRSEGLRAMREAAVAGEPRAQLDLALLLLDDGRVHEALAWAQRSAQQLPMHAPARRALGKVALRANMPHLALTEFELALALEPKQLSNQFNLALALITLGRGREARPYLEASQRDPALAPDATRLLQRL